MKSKLVGRFSCPGQHWRFYAVALGATVGLIALLFVVGTLIQSATAGQFPMFGHPDGATTISTDQSVVYRPGSLLLAYYMIAFSLLLVHYQHDGFFFFRTRDLVDGPNKAA